MVLNTVLVDTLAHNIFYLPYIVLEKYELHEFVPLVGGIRKGDLRAFNDALVDFQDRFIRYVHDSTLSLPLIVVNYFVSLYLHKFRCLSILHPKIYHWNTQHTHVQSRHLFVARKMQNGRLSQLVQTSSLCVAKASDLAQHGCRRLQMARCTGRSG